MSFLCFQVNNRAQMQFSRTRMRIMNGTKSVFLQDQVEIPDIGGQVRYIYGCVFDDRNGFCITRKIPQPPQPRFSKRPSLLCILPEKQRSEERRVGNKCGTK